jgi:hypothetical protein
MVMVMCNDINALNVGYFEDPTLALRGVTMFNPKQGLETLKLQESQFTRAPYMSNRVVSEERVVAYSAEFVTDSASLAMAAARSGLIREGGRGQVGLHLTRSESPLERPGLSGRRS